MKRIVINIMAAALIALPAVAQQEWQSTSSMQGSGSAYTPQISEVGSTNVPSVATTTEAYSPNQAPNRARKTLITPSDPGQQSNEGPIGSAWALLTFAAVGGAVVLRRRKGQRE